MNQLDLTKNGGLKFTQQILEFMQSSYTDTIMSLARAFGDKVILTGCVITGGSISDGWLLLDGVPTKFIGGALDTKIVVNVTTEDVVFKNGIAQPVKQFVTATCAGVGAFDFSLLVRLDELISTQNTLTDLVTSFNALSAAFGTHTHTWASINGKPIGAFVSYKGSYAIGDVGNTSGGADTIATISIPEQPNANYVIAGSLVGQNSNLDLDNDVSWVLGAKTTTSFKIALREYASAAQNVVFEFVIYN